MPTTPIVWLSAACLVTVVAACAQPAQHVELRNERLAATFAPEHGGAVVSLRDLAADRELVPDGVPARLFQLEFTERGKPLNEHVWLSGADAAEVRSLRQDEQGRTTVRQEFNGLGGRQVNVVCTAAVAPGDPYLRFRIGVDVPDGLTLESVRYPCLTLRAPLQDGVDDAVVFGATKGGIHPKPAAWPKGRWTAYTQPGSLAAQFDCCYDTRSGLMTAAFDRVGWPKTAVASRGEDGLELAWLLPCHTAGRFAPEFDLVMTTFAGADGAPADWRDAADLYKAWAVQQPWCAKTYAQRDDLPEWLKDGPAMVRFGRDWLAHPEQIETWLRDYWHQRFPATVPLIVAYWGWEKVATWVTPDYFPVYPSDEQFRAMVELERKLGGHAFLWPSGYHYTVTYDKQPDGGFAWDDRERFERDAAPHAVCGPDGKVATFQPSWLRGGTCATLCPGDPYTFEWLNYLAEQIVQRGAEIVQVDQVVGGRYPPCYHNNHGHPVGPGPWQTEVFHHQLETMLQRCRAIDPNAVVCFEEPNEWYLQQVGIQDYRDWEVLRRNDVEPASVFNYVYHEYLPTFQSNPRAGDRLMTAWCLVNGQIPHLVPSRDVLGGPLLHNGTFEQRSGDRPEGWDRVSGWQGKDYTGRSELDATEQHEGAVSLRVTNTGNDEIGQISQNVMVGRSFRVGGTYRVSARLKSKGIQPSNGVLLGLLGDNLRSTGGARLPYPPEEAGWQLVEATLTVAPGTELLRIMVHLQGPGTVWVDDLHLSEVRPDGTAAELMRPEVPGDHELMRSWVELFHGEGRPYLLLGRMLHPPRLDVESIQAGERRFPAVFHNAYEAPDGSRAVVLVNAAETKQAARLTWAGRTIDLTLAPAEVRLVR